ncbi:MAG: F0F1 ATP synthase subunit B family protein [Methanobacteriota archaeon]
MNKEETLHRIKSVEEEVRRTLDGAQAERERILRNARKETLELRDGIRADAERRGEAILRDAETTIAKAKERVLAEGRKEAASLRSMADSNMDRAVERLIERFKGAIHA